MAFALVPLVLLAACGAGSEGEGDLRIEDPWVKAVDEGMTAAFGTLYNGTDDTIHVTAVSSPASEHVELHETVTDANRGTTMQEVPDGFTIDPGESLLLEPGGDHIMLMGVNEPLLAGNEVEITLEFADGTTWAFTATVKDFEGANESYEDHAHLDHEDHEEH